MIQFSDRQPVSKQTEAASTTRTNSAAGSQRVAGTCRENFPETLAAITTDPNASLVTSTPASVNSTSTGSQSSVAGQNSAVAKTGWNALIPPTPSTAIPSASSEAKIPTEPYPSNVADNT